MPARQIWLFLLERDVSALIDDLQGREPGLVTSWGRYLQGNPRDLLDDPSRLARRESLPGERRLYLLHRKHSSEVVTHLQPLGPFAGWMQIDEERTDALVLKIPDAREGEIQPARLYAHTTYWRGAEKFRKRPMFSIWASQMLKWLVGRYGKTSVPFLRIGTEALVLARRREIRLTYLYREIAAEPTERTEVALPEGTVTEDSPEPVE
ncbi:MAG: hypothetical protein E6J62_00610 [Deltaproteobacteria bacterium]|nr:MAG: hypothetical protein E6J85_18685 [Deltaproteobacteria bacterium]TMB40161.1 MAG: hypothetical protein E6J62_00610 [Deltaproteobacteria bacterium]